MKKLTEVQKNVLKDIALNNKKIYHTYRQIENQNHEETLYHRIFPLIRNEKYFFSLLDITPEFKEQVEEWVEERVDFIPDEEFLISPTTSITSDNYQYLRLLARVRYFSLDLSKDTDKFRRNFIDSETILLFNGLFNSLDTHQTSSEEILHQAFLTLLDSPEAELHIILNGLRPIHKIDDYIDLIAETSILRTLLENYDTVKQYEKITFTTSAKQLKVREKRVITRLPYLISTLNYHMSNCGSPYELETSIEFLTALEYLKALIAFSKPEYRAIIYKSLLEKEYFSRDAICYDYLIALLKNAFNEIEDETVKNIYFYTLLPKKRKI